MGDQQSLVWRVVGRGAAMNTCCFSCLSCICLFSWVFRKCGFSPLVLSCAIVLRYSFLSFV